MKELNLQTATIEELVAERNDCLRWLDFWGSDLDCPDEDVASEAYRQIRRINRWLAEVDAEIYSRQWEEVEE